MQERKGKDIWKGLYDFPMIESHSHIESPDAFMDDAVIRQLLSKGVIREIPKLYTHLLTHQKLNVQFWWIDLPKSQVVQLPAGAMFYDSLQVQNLPKPILVDTVLKAEGYL